MIVRYVCKIIIYWKINYTGRLEEGWNQWLVERNYCFAPEDPSEHYMNVTLYSNQ